VVSQEKSGWVTGGEQKSAVYEKVHEFCGVPANEMQVIATNLSLSEPNSAALHRFANERMPPIAPAHTEA
jgi:hypothetical protein